MLSVMKKSHPTPRPLVLAPETVKLLKANDLTDVVGGIPIIYPTVRRC